MKELTTFILPRRYAAAPFDFDGESVSAAAVIPTYKPQTITAQLVTDMVRWHPRVDVYVVDDCTPEESVESMLVIKGIRATSSRVTLLRTPRNTLKAGALNLALRHMNTRGLSYDVVLTLDDDVVIDPLTVKNIVRELMSNDDLAAVCAQCRVLNKNKNLLTRLQALEYVGFNAVRLADEGFFKGPLVMPGMLTAFRAKALSDVGGFAEGHLIEDYEITARLKARGWSVKSALTVSAWTVVPHTFSALWRQRTRWSYGGITVVLSARNFRSVLQDVLGHGIFIATVLMIALLLLVRVDGSIPAAIAYWIIGISFLQLFTWYAFNLWLMHLYREKDTLDWVIRTCVIPEFIYGNLMAAILIGSYLFLVFTTLKRSQTLHNPIMRTLVACGNWFFGAFGYADTWGGR